MNNPISNNTLVGKIKVLLVLEGSYPFHGGGISTWAHQLTHNVSNAQFVLYSVNANVEEECIYELSDAIEEVIQVPIWAPNEPHDYINYGKSYYKIAYKKSTTSEEIIIKSFIIIFERLLHQIFNEEKSPKDIDAIFYEMYHFFRDHDFKLTLTSKSVWNTFKTIIFENITSGRLKDYTITIQDVTVALQWIYRFLIPLSINVPKVDVSHITLSGFPVIPALTLKYRYNTPMIITEHGVFIRERLLAINSSEYSFFLKDFLINFSECITKLAYHKADMIISVNEFNKIWETKFGAAKNKLKVVYNGVDHTLFKPGPKPEHLKDIPTVVAAARIFELKDIITMIKTCNEVRKEIPNVQFLVYGNKQAVPEYTLECESLIKELSLENNFKLAGHHPEPHLIYTEGDISILTSISEGFPFTVIESMSCGVPVVSTDVGGVYEALDEKSGFLCKPKDEKQIASKVVQLLNDDELRKQMGIHARERVEKYFKIHNVIEGYENAYAEVFERTNNMDFNEEILLKKEVS